MITKSREIQLYNVCADNHTLEEQLNKVRSEAIELAYAIDKYYEDKTTLEDITEEVHGVNITSQSAIILINALGKIDIQEIRQEQLKKFEDYLVNEGLI